MIKEMKITMIEGRVVRTYDMKKMNGVSYARMCWVHKAKRAYAFVDICLIISVSLGFFFYRKKKKNDKKIIVEEK